MKEAARALGRLKTKYGVYFSYGNHDRGYYNTRDFKDKELRITPPGTIVGSNIRIASPKLITFKLTAKTKIGEIYLSVGFAEGD